MASSSVTAQPASKTALGPPPSPPRIEVIGHASGVDLAELGPDFVQPWLAALRDALGCTGAAPTRVEHHDPASGHHTRTTFRYDEAGRRLEAHTATRRDTGWVPTRRTTYRYQRGRLASFHEAIWTGNAWQPEHRWTVCYDEQGRLARATQHIRPGSASGWVPATQLRLTDGADAYRIEQHVREGSTWAPVARATFTAAAGETRVIQEVDLWGETGWSPGSRTTLTYGVAGRPIEAHTTLWTSTHWAEGPQQLYTHVLRGKRVVRSTETWMGTLHLGTRTATFTYATPPADPLLLGDQGVE